MAHAISRTTALTEMQPTVSSHSGTLALYFNKDEIQSQMHEDAPDELVLPYTRTIMSFLLLNPSPRHIAVIGLGGGSIPKWCYRNLAHTAITTLEINPHILALREDFRIPPDDHRFRILHQDGAHYAATTSDRPDAVIVDGFGPTGQPPELCTQHFYDDCHRILSEDGILIANLCDPQDQTHLARIRSTFADRVFVITFNDGQNKVVFASKPAAPHPRRLEASCG